MGRTKTRWKDEFLFWSRNRPNGLIHKIIIDTATYDDHVDQRTRFAGVKFSVEFRDMYRRISGEVSWSNLI